MYEQMYKQTMNKPASQPASLYVYLSVFFQSEKTTKARQIFSKLTKRVQLRLNTTQEKSSTVINRQTVFRQYFFFMLNK